MTFGVFAGNQIHQLRSNSLAEKLQIVLDMAEMPQFNAFSLPDPARIVIDIQARAAKQYRNNLSFKQRGVTLVRTGMQNPNEVRIVLDLKRDYRWDVYALAADNRHGPRVVIDVFDGKGNAQKGRREQSLSNIAVNSNPLIKSDGDNTGELILESVGDVARLKAPVKSQPAQTDSDNKKTAKATKTVTASTATSIEKPPKQSPKKPEQQTLKTTAKVTAKTTVKPDKKPPQSKPKETPPALQETTSKPHRQSEIVIVIDPGHGGKDSGAVGPNRTKEKDVVLQISKRLKRKIDALPNMRAVLTRSNDRYITLRGRLRLARKHKADLFVSVHADAFTNRAARGSSVFILSNRGASSEAARWLAKSENSVDLKYGVDIGDYDKDVSNVLVKMQQDAAIEASYVVANKTLRQLKGIGKVHKRRVERAGFAVLKSPDIPSMLVETAFISNPEEERRLKSPNYQERLAESIAKGIQAYFKERLPHHLLLRP